MRFGLQKLTLLDYPGNVACTIFCSGCNFCCPYCHNPELALGKEISNGYNVSELLSFLESRVNKLDGICITGGEPLLFSESIELAQKAKSMGYKVKIDTNGSDPVRLAEVVRNGYADYIAMDIKNSPEKYEMTAGRNFLEKVKESIAFLMGSEIDYEFRTTVTGNLHTASDFEKIGQWLSGAKRYFLQKFVDSGSILNGNGASFEVCCDNMYEYQQIVARFVPTVQLRGI